WAFFSLPTRMWELIAGACIALGASRLAGLRPSVAGAIGGLGLGAIVWSAVHFSASTAFPGTAALVPVAGTVAVVVRGCAAPPRGVGSLLGRRPMQLIGRCSYAWYLWHWPALVLLPVIAGHALSSLQRLAAVGGSALVAYATTEVMERRFRFAPAFVTHPRRSLALGGGLTALALTATLLAGATLS